MTGKLEIATVPAVAIVPAIETVPSVETVPAIDTGCTDGRLEMLTEPRALLPAGSASVRPNVHTPDCVTPPTTDEPSASTTPPRPVAIALSAAIAEAAPAPDQAASAGAPSAAPATASTVGIGAAVVTGTPFARMAFSGTTFPPASSDDPSASVAPVASLTEIVI